MLKRLIRDPLGKRNEKKALNPDVRGMLLNLDGVYEKISTDSRPPAASEQHVDATRKP